MPRAKKASDVKGITLENAHPNIERIPTKLFSFDHATGGGLPLRSVLEISGYEYSTKSTLGYHVVGRAGESIPGLRPATVTIADFEGLDPQYIMQAMKASGFSGNLRLVPLVNAKGKPQMSEVMLDWAAKDLMHEDTYAVMIDSVGAIYTLSEEGGNVGEGRVGRRASIMADFLRKCIFRMRWKETPSIVVLTNHIHEVIGGRGTITSGGKAVAYLSATRVRLSADKKDDHWTVSGKVGKLRYRGDKPTASVFQYIVVPGEGIHLGLSAMQDCILFGLAKEERTIQMNGKSFGFRSKLVKNRDDADLFAPFHSALQQMGEVEIADADEEE